MSRAVRKRLFLLAGAGWLVLALAAVRPLADALALLDLAGSIGIDFPTLSDKNDRKQVDGRL